ncbi:TPA: oligosaccharide repeat unit polymerase [Vibrio vulnificus]|nr:oligosaccharide repeat unit polymerase [Vibrio vulnificus]
MEIVLYLSILVVIIFLCFHFTKTFSIESFILVYMSLWCLSSIIISLTQGWYISIASYFIHIIFALSFCTSALFIRKRCVTYEFRVCSPKRLNYFFSYFNFLGLIGLLHHVSQFGFNLNLYEIAQQASISRYNNENVSSIQILTSSFIFCNFFILGFCSKKDIKTKNKLILIFIILFLSILTSSKANLIISLTFFIAGCFNKFVLTGYKFTYSVKSKLLTRSIMASAVAFAFLVLLQTLRYGVDNFSWAIVDRMLVYAFGQFSAFSIWFDKTSIEYMDLGLGYGLFTGLYSRVLGIERIFGFYDTFTYISGTDYTNVFSLSRLIISDFTFLGGCVFLFLVGIVWRVIYKGTKRLTTVIFFLTCISVESFFGFGTSILSYNNVILAIFLILLVFNFNFKYFESAKNESFKNTH